MCANLQLRQHFRNTIQIDSYRICPDRRSTDPQVAAENYLPLPHGGAHPLKLFDTPITVLHCRVKSFYTYTYTRVYAIISYTRLLQ